MKNIHLELYRILVCYFGSEEFEEYFFLSEEDSFRIYKGYKEEFDSHHNGCVYLYKTYIDNPYFYAYKGGSWY